MSRYELSVPGNILLAGEYVITRPGGTGLALAVGPRATATVETRKRESLDPALTVEANMGSVRIRWPEWEIPIVPAVVDSLEIEGIELPRQRSVTTVVDTSRFFRHGSGKLGLGSSAAAAVLISASLLAAAGLDPAADLSSLARIAHRAHRASKDGRGSGYDVYASTFGGAGKFYAARKPHHEPSWERLAAPLLSDLRMFGWVNRSPVDTASGIDRFETVCMEDRSWAESVLKGFNKLVATIVRALDGDAPAAFFRAVDESRRLGVAIGDRIGVPARIGELEEAFTRSASGSENARWSFKATGAGDERAMVFAYEPPGISGLAPVHLESVGLRCVLNREAP